MNFLTNKNILIISPEAWGHIPVSKHHYARILADKGNRVYFLNPPSSSNRMIEDAQYRGVFVVDYVTFKGVNRLPAFLRNFLNRILIKKIERLCKTSFDVIWTFDPFRFQNLKLFKSQVRIYHAVDIHTSALEYELARTSDLILAVSEMILSRFDTLKKVKQKINHGLSSHFFAKPKELISVSPGTHVGYIGNLDNWCIDIPTLLTIVKQHRSVTFHFIGPHKPESKLGNALLKLENCIVHGRVPSEKLPAYLYQFDLFLMSYKGDEADVNSNHHKILEYLAIGKPVVINFTDEYKDKRDLVFMADKNDELPGIFADVLKNLQIYSNAQLLEKRRSFAFANSYQQHVETIDNLIIRAIK